MTLTSYTQTLKDFYALPGTRLKQYVVDTNREYAWERETAPKFTMDPHDDNTELTCRNVGPVPMTYLQHDCCAVCDEAYERAAASPAGQAWLAEKAKRPPICADRSLLSDELAPEWPAMRQSPIMAMVPRGERDPGDEQP